MAEMHYTQNEMA